MAKRSVTTKSVARKIALAAVITGCLCSSLMNFRFGFQLAQNPTDGWLWACFGVCLDVTKWFALGASVSSWHSGARLKTMAGTALWSVAVVYSFLAATGFSALQRDTIVAERSRQTEAFERAGSDHDELSRDLAVMKASPRYAKTTGCTDVTASASKALCEEIRNKEVKLKEAGLVFSAGSPTAADPQAVLLSGLTGMPEGSVRKGLAIFLAIVTEILSSLGVFAMTAPSRVQNAKIGKRGRRRAVGRSKPTVRRLHLVADNND